MSGAGKLRDAAALVAELDRRRRENRAAYYEPYGPQLAFHAAGATKRERLFSAGNQCGKTLSGAMEMNFHLTGEYPPWWPGRRFEKPVSAWAGGVTGQSTRDNPQRLLAGPLGAWGTGAIPRHALDRKPSMSRHLADAIDTMLVRHRSGGYSQLQFKSYDQGRLKWQGASLDVVWADEEPDADIYSEAKARITATRGLAYITATPLLGMSDVQHAFHVEDSPDRAIVFMDLSQAKHVPAEDRARIEAGYPAHEREARMRGFPMLGSGRVFQIEEAAIVETQPEIPPYWPRIVGVDFGWDHPTAAVWLAWDRDVDVVHVYGAYRLSQATPLVHAPAIKARGSWIPCAWPHDGLQHDKGSGEQIAEQYRAQGVRMLSDRATFTDGTNGLEAGVIDMLGRMQTGRLKVAAHLTEWLEEFRGYHRKDGLIVKRRDDLLSATRYALMMLRFAETEPDHDDEAPRHRLSGGADFDPFKW